ncbi:low molecular weight phosphotyrosine protein phosphatase [Pseudomonas sp. R2.Fl]|nr:low molecular weight phosphotyrosine protein phosphatase [Pseudomonas sp. R2.Fl]
MYQVLIVCVGNICRSPMAEAVLHAHGRGSGLRVRSAGLAARVGDGLHPIAAELLAENGLELDRHVARQIDLRMLVEADLILAMEQRQLRALEAIAPPLRNRMHLLGRWNGRREIRDPCGKQRDAFVHAFDLIGESARAWCERMPIGSDSRLFAVPAHS